MDEQDDVIRCPKCTSSQIHAEKRRWSITTGMIGKNKIYITCLKCGNRFAPGEMPSTNWADEVSD